MLPGTYNTDAVQSLDTRILVAGIEREWAEWSVSRELVGDLPEQVAGGSGIKQATGKVEWAEGEDVSDTLTNLFNPSSGWAPSSNDPVVILVSDGVTEWPVFTGLIDETETDGQGRVSSTLIDGYDALSVVIDHEPMMSIMPPYAEGGNFRPVGLSALVYVNHALRSAGYFATPAMGEGCSFSAPLVDSVWAERGEVFGSASFDMVATGPEFSASVWGRACRNADVRYVPTAGRTSGEPVTLVIMADPTHAGLGYVEAQFGTETFRLEVTADRFARVRVNGAILHTGVMGTAVTVSASYDGSGAVTYRSDTGQVGTFAASLGAGHVLNAVKVTATPEARIGGVQVFHPSTVAAAAAPTAYIRSARINVGNLTGVADALPAIVSRTSKEVLDEISSATLSAMWIDSAGIFQYWGSDQLKNQPPARTVTTADDVLDISTRQDLLSVSREVAITYSRPAVSRSRTSNITVYDGAGTSLDTGQTEALFLEAPADEEWYQVDETLTFAGLTEPGFINRGRGSVAGGVHTDGTNEQWANSPTLNVLGATMEGLNGRKWLFTVWSTHTNPEYQIELRTVADGVAGADQLWPSSRKAKLPLIRARGRVMWAEQTRKFPAGPAGAALVHECGPWVSRDGSDVSTVNAIGNFLVSQVSVPIPSLPRLDIDFDPRIQLGDVLAVSSPSLMGVELVVLIVGIRSEASEGYTQSLSARIVSASRTFTTYREFERKLPDSLTYEQWRALLPSTATYQTFNTDPLIGAQ